MGVSTDTSGSGESVSTPQTGIFIATLTMPSGRIAYDLSLRSLGCAVSESGGFVWIAQDMDGTWWQCSVSHLNEVKLLQRKRFSAATLDGSLSILCGA